MAHFTLTPAYGRDYTSKADVIAAFESGMDFVDASWDASGTYVNRPQIPDGALVNLRYHRLAKVAVHRAGQLPKSRKPRRELPPAPTCREHFCSAPTRRVSGYCKHHDSPVWK